MANLNSTLVKAFPAVNRSVEHSGDPYARHTSEQTVSSIVNKLIDTDGFVITKLENNYILDSANPFAFNIYGYYFKVDKLSDILNLWTDDYWASKGPGTYTIYAEIVVAPRGKVDSENVWWEMAGQDEEQTVEIDGITTTTWKYSALDFTIGKPFATSPYAKNNGWAYYIPLFDYTYNSDIASRSIIVQNSYYMKFGGPSFEIDGGDLDKE